MASSLSIIFYVIGPIFSQLICDNPFQCVNQTLTIPNSMTLFQVRGYHSASGSLTSIDITPNEKKNSKLDFECRCIGSFSCQSISSIQINRDNVLMNCQGTNSCSNTTLFSQNIATIFGCYALNSCMFSLIQNINSDDIRLDCYGETSCAYSNIKAIQHIYGSGTYSLYRAIIDSYAITSDLSVSLRGKLAGYGAVLICRTGHICHIDCKGYDSCYMFYIQCDGDCDITLSSDDFIAPITDTAFNDTSIHQIHIINNEELCNTHPSAIAFDNYNEHLDMNLIINDTNGAPICCRGTGSCKRNKVQYISTTTSSFVCSGGFSCASFRIEANNATIYCEGADSCKSNAQIMNASYVYCLGFWSCYISQIIGTPHIVCSARQSCRNATIYSDGVDINVYFYGVESGMDAVIHCNESDSCNIICSVYKSCLGTTLLCYGSCTTECHPKSECPLDGISSIHPTLYPSMDSTQTITETLYPIVNPSNNTAHISSYPSIDSNETTTLYPTTNPSNSIAHIPSTAVLTTHEPSSQSTVVEIETNETNSPTEIETNVMDDIVNETTQQKDHVLFIYISLLVVLIAGIGFVYFFAKKRKLTVRVIKNNENMKVNLKRVNNNNNLQRIVSVSIDETDVKIGSLSQVCGENDVEENIDDLDGDMNETMEGPHDIVLNCEDKKHHTHQQRQSFEILGDGENPQDSTMQMGKEGE